MLSLILLFFSLFLQIISQNINFATNCENNNVYNSINYKCENCDGTKGLNVCYSSNSRSIFTFEAKTFQSSCEADEIATEADEDGNILSQIICAKDDFDFTDVDDTRYKNAIESSDSQLRLSVYIRTGTILTIELDNLNLKYYELSCLEGAFEKSCDYIVNLYALSMYRDDNNFGNIITSLNNILHEKNIL